MKKLLTLAAIASVVAFAGCNGKQSDFRADYQSVMPWQYDETPVTSRGGNDNVVVEYSDDELLDAQKTPRRSVYNAESIYAGDVDDPLIQQLVDELWNEIEDLKRLDEKAAREAEMATHYTDDGAPVAPADEPEETQTAPPDTGE